MAAPFSLLVPLDGSTIAEAALPAAERLAGSQGRICLVRVMPPIDARAEEVLHRYLPAAGLDPERPIAQARHDLIETAARWGGTLPHMDVAVRRGEPAEEILRAAEEMNASMIVIASHGRGALGRWRYGSVADRVVRASAIPVMVVRQNEAALDQNLARFERIVLPYDGSEVAAQAIPMVETLARRLEIPVRVLRVVDVNRILAGSAIDVPIPADLYEQLEIDLRNEAQHSVDEVAGRLRAGEVTAEGAVFFGTVSQAILDALAPGDVLVMSSHGRTGVRRWVLGSVAEKLIRLADVPVVLVPARERQEHS
ncbi:MAG: universal stress protein [Thermomicrobiales bacterium]|nr:universal stress protein [Thermomicrobiales bacterium]